MTQATASPTSPNVLVTVHRPGHAARSYLFDRSGRHAGMDPDYFVARDRAHEATTWFVPRRTGIISRALTGLFVASAVTIGALGVTHTVSLRVVLTGSMIPAIEPGDAVVTVNDSHRAPRLGDVVVYTGTRFDGTPVAPFAHRIIGGSADAGWIVKGDNNPAADVQRPTAKDITGVVVATVPAIGRFLSAQLLLALALAGFAIWLILDGIGDGR